LVSQCKFMIEVVAVAEILVLRWRRFVNIVFTRCALELRLPGSPLLHAALAAGVTLHALRAPGGLPMLLVQVGPVQASYVTLPACSAECRIADCATIGCLAAAFARLVQTEAPLWRVRRALELNPRPYTRAVCAAPGTDAQPLDGTMLHPWSDARLHLHWRTRRGAASAAAVQAILLAGADGPDPVVALRARGWMARPVPPALALVLAPLLAPARSVPALAPTLLVPQPDPQRAPVQAASAPIAARRVRSPLDTPLTPLAPPMARPAAIAVAASASDGPALPAFVSAAQASTWPGAIWHTSGRPRPSVSPPAVVVAPTTALAALDDAPPSPFAGELHLQRAAQLLGLVPPDPQFALSDDGNGGDESNDQSALAPLSEETRLTTTLQEDTSVPAFTSLASEPPSIWPDGPLPVRAAQVGALMDRLLSDPVITDPPAPGVTKKRIRAMLPPNTPTADAVAMALLMWFDAAAIIAPTVPERRWRDPRPFCTDIGRDAIAAALRATPLPDAPSVAAVNATLKQNA
jgi:hypothetical protein